MNIWYFHHYGTPYELPGLHRPFEFGTYFNDKGNKTAVFTSSYLHFSGDNMITDGKGLFVNEYNGVHAVFIKTCGYKNSKLKRVINMAEFGLRLNSAADFFSENYWIPDIIIASSPDLFTLTAGLRIAKKYNIPCICEIRDFWPEVFFCGGLISEKGIIGRLLLKLEKSIYTKADKLVFLKEGDPTYISDKKWDIESGGTVDMKKCAYINNGVDIRLFDRRAEKFYMPDPDLDNDKFTVIYCGTIRPVNNVGMLLDAAKLTGNDVEFLIYGNGSCVDELKRRIKDEHISNVKLKGYINNKYVPSVLKRSSLNILNYSGSAYNWSRGNSSNKLFEYLASGKPVVSTVKMGYDLLERYSCGVSADPTTAQNIAEKILFIKNLSHEDYSEYCTNARIAAEEFDIPVLTEKYLRVMNDTKRNGSGANIYAAAGTKH